MDIYFLSIAVCHLVHCTGRGVSDCNQLVLCFPSNDCGLDRLGWTVDW